MKLRPYQETSVEYLLSHKGAILYLTVGLGKTLCALEALRRLSPKNVLLTVPLALKPWWRAQIGEMFGEPVEVDQLVKNVPVYKTPGGTRWVMAHYAALREGVKAAPLISATNYDVVIADELHHIKNRKSEQTKGLKKIKSDYRWGLTGTLISEKASEAWSPLHWADPKYFSSFWKFYDHFIMTVLEGGYPVEVGVWDAEALSQEISRCVLHLTRTQVGVQLPTLTVSDVPIVFEKDQRDFYNEIKKNIIIELTEEAALYGLSLWEAWKQPKLFIKNGMTRFLRLHQVASTPTIFKAVSDAKLAWLETWLEESDETAAIFSRYIPTVDKVNTLLRKMGKRNFDVGTYGKLAEGLNLQRHHNLIMVDLPWSRMQYDQAIGRIDRLGQTHATTVYRLMAEKTVDKHALDLIENKREMTEQIILWLEELGGA